MTVQTFTLARDCAETEAESASAPLEALYRAHSTEVYSLARRLCRCASDADDVLQETFLEASRSLSRYRGDAPVGAWLKKIAVSKALMRLRASGRFDLDADLPEAACPPPEGERLALERALACLTDAGRVVVLLHDLEGYTHDEIADLLGASPSSSKSRLARAHARLRQLLEGAAR